MMYSTSLMAVLIIKQYEVFGNHFHPVRARVVGALVGRGYGAARRLRAA